MTEKTAKALIDAINRLIETLGRPQSVVHHHYTRPTTQPGPYTSPYSNPYYPYTQPYGGTTTTTTLT